MESSSCSPSGSLDALQEYSHLNEVVGLFRAALDEVLPLLQGQATSDPAVSIEIEGRLGVFGERGFSPDVGKDAFFSILSTLESYSRWQKVLGWAESQDVYYTVDVPRQYSGADKALRAQVRTSVGVDGQRQLVLVHCIKTKLKTVDMRLKSRGEDTCLLRESRRHPSARDGPAPRCAAARLAISLERKIPVGTLPIAVIPDFVRIKQRKRFLLNSLGVELPAFSVDMTLVHSGRSKQEAEQKQASGTDTQYEVEVECLEPLAYLRSCQDDSAVLALSIILKLLDFAAIVNPEEAVSYCSEG